MRRLGIALLGLVLLAGPRAAGAVTAKGVVGPVAVLPFKNLNQNPKLDWLSVGIAETMLSDVKHSGRVEVVERDQIDKALAQIALQGELKMAPATAVKVGKIVGAKTIVLGAYQEAGRRIRITARFVSVETGVVTDAAEVTGPISRIFHLQDAIVGRLLGSRRGHRYRPPRREKGSARTVKAYRLYAMSLSVASAVQRVTYLKQAVKVDPSFHYATDALAALEERMRGYEATHRQRVSSANDKLRQEIRAGTRPGGYLVGDASRVLAYDESHFDWYQYLADGDLIAHSKVPAHFGGFDRAQLVLFSKVLGNYMLHKNDLALQYGEAYMKRYPGGSYFGSVKYDMQCIIDRRHEIEKGKKTLVKRLAEIARERASTKKRMKIYPKASRNLVSLDLRECVAYVANMQYQAGIPVCQSFIDAHDQATDKPTRQLLLTAYYYKADALMWLGRFDEARKVVDRVRAKKLPGYEDLFKDIEETWPPARSP